MDTPYLPPDGARCTGSTSPAPPGRSPSATPGGTAATGWDDWEDDPTIDRYTLDTAGEWTVLGGGAVDVSGRLVGGCIETMVGDRGDALRRRRGFGRGTPTRGCRLSRGVRARRVQHLPRTCTGCGTPAGSTRANAVLIGRTRAPDAGHADPARGGEDALGMLGVPVRGRRRLRPRAAVPPARERCRWPGWSSTATGARSPRSSSDRCPRTPRQRRPRVAGWAAWTNGSAS